MPFIGSIIPRNVAAPDTTAEKLRRAREDKKRTDKASAFSEILDEAELASVEEIRETERSQEAQELATEEGTEDRQKHGSYQPGGMIPPQRKPTIDIKG
ncbi:MAG: hypothetical protein AAFX05_00445 [Planctomycetota bacterium]